MNEKQLRQRYLIARDGLKMLERDGGNKRDRELAKSMMKDAERDLRANGWRVP